MQVTAGINKFKAATISEASMIAQHGGKDILLAYQPIGPNIPLLIQLIEQYPEVSFAAIVDHEDAVNLLSTSMQNARLSLRVRIDVDCGMHRTGIPFGKSLNALRALIEQKDGLEYEGLHVYDGHLHQPDAETRRRATEDIIKQVETYDKYHTSGEVVEVDRQPSTSGPKHIMGMLIRHHPLRDMGYPPIQEIPMRLRSHF